MTTDVGFHKYFDELTQGDPAFDVIDEATQQEVRKDAIERAKEAIETTVQEAIDDEKQGNTDGSFKAIQHGIPDSSLSPMQLQDARVLQHISSTGISLSELTRKLEITDANGHGFALLAMNLGSPLRRLIHNRRVEKHGPVYGTLSA